MRFLLYLVEEQQREIQKQFILTYHTLDISFWTFNETEEGELMNTVLQYTCIFGPYSPSGEPFTEVSRCLEILLSGDF